jgi:hypothetical protein
VYRGLPIVVALLLAGCAGNAADRPEAQASAAAGAQQTAAAVPQPDDDAVCRSKGYQPGSSPYVQCRKQLDAQHAQQLKNDPDSSSWSPERENVARDLLGRPPAAN